MGAYSINFVGLSNNIHHFDYDFGDEFFKQYGTILIEKGSFHADVELNKHETFLEVNFKIKGTATLICDRSLEPFEFPIKNSHKVVFKFGDQDEELTDEIVMIHRDTVTLELGQYLYEFIALDVPLKSFIPVFKTRMKAMTKPQKARLFILQEETTRQRMIPEMRTSTLGGIF